LYKFLLLHTHWDPRFFTLSWIRQAKKGHWELRRVHLGWDGFHGAVLDGVWSSGTQGRAGFSRGFPCHDYFQMGVGLDAVLISISWHGAKSTGGRLYLPGVPRSLERLDNTDEIFMMRAFSKNIPILPSQSTAIRGGRCHKFSGPQVGSGGVQTTRPERGSTRNRRVIPPSLTE
jgi:hypothetical protein